MTLLSRHFKNYEMNKLFKKAGNSSSHGSSAVVSFIYLAKSVKGKVKVKLLPDMDLPAAEKFYGQNSSIVCVPEGTRTFTKLEPSKRIEAFAPFILTPVIP